MKLYAFAALLALPILGSAAQPAKADDYCCGGYKKPYHFVTKDFYVIKDAVVFGCDGYHCETNVKLLSDIYIKARCRNGWCEIRSFPFKDAWVLESCLQHVYDKYKHSSYSDRHSRGGYYPDHESDPGYPPRY